MRSFMAAAVEQAVAVVRDEHEIVVVKCRQRIVGRGSEPRALRLEQRMAVGAIDEPRLDELARRELAHVDVLGEVRGDAVREAVHVATRSSARWRAMMPAPPTCRARAASTPATQRDCVDRFVSVDVDPLVDDRLADDAHAKRVACATNSFNCSSVKPSAEMSLNSTCSLRSSGLSCAASGDDSRKCDSFVDENVSPDVKWMRPP